MTCYSTFSTLSPATVGKTKPQTHKRRPWLAVVGSQPKTLLPCFPLPENSVDFSCCPSHSLVFYCLALGGTLTLVI